MDTNKSYQIIRVAKKYYELHMGQLEIAQEEGVSKSTISRMLQKAIDLGYVKVTIDAPVESVKEMEDQLKQTFHLKEVFVSPNLVDDEEINLRDTCRALAGNLDKYIIDNTVVAVSWGNTLNCLAGQIQPLKAKDIKVVQLNGGVAKSASSTGAGGGFVSIVVFLVLILLSFTHFISYQLYSFATSQAAEYASIK